MAAWSCCWGRAIIVYEAINRFYHSESDSGKLVMLIAGIGVLGNGFSALLLHRDNQRSLNMRGAFLHMVGDLLSSVAVLATGLGVAISMYWPRS